MDFEEGTNGLLTAGFRHAEPRQDVVQDLVNAVDQVLQLFAAIIGVKGGALRTRSGQGFFAATAVWLTLRYAMAPPRVMGSTMKGAMSTSG